MVQAQHLSEFKSCGVGASQRCSIALTNSITGGQVASVRSCRWGAQPRAVRCTGVL